MTRTLISAINREVRELGSENAREARVARIALVQLESEFLPTCRGIGAGLEGTFVMYGWSQADKLIKLSTFFLDDRRYRLTIDVEPTFDGVMITAAGTYRSADLLPRINAEFGAALETRVDCDVIDGQRVYRRA